MQKNIAEINLKAVQYNATAWKNYTHTKLCAVVKADAYGHGAERITLALSNIADSFAVALIEEGIAIKTVACGKDILVFTPPVTENQAEELIKNGFIITVDGEDALNLVIAVAKRLNKGLRIHLKINTGMNRYGMTNAELEKVLEICKSNLVVPEGIYSHIYSHTETTARTQKTLFDNAISIAKKYFTDIKPHLSATYGAMLGKDFAYETVRIGLGLYGYIPTDVEEKYKLSSPKLEKCMKVYSYCVTSRKYEFGGTGYGVPTEPKSDFVSVIRSGYADGNFRKKELCGNFGNLLNDLCMDVAIVGEKSERGKVVCVMQDADEVAKVGGTSAYEILCNSTKRAIRRYTYKTL